VIWIAAWYTIISLITFAMYGLDKRKAIHGYWRIKENTLHLLELLGGWPGAYVAQRFFHHKTIKTSYQLAFWTIVTLHMAVWVFVIYRWR
jgi:uncharacterized membrane protein YsdA (DUF1294 family)